MTSVDGWDPAQYNKFASEREQPYWDLTGLLNSTESPVIADLGCGDGRLTSALADRLGASSALGVDSSPAMIAEAQKHTSDRVKFERGDIGAWEQPGSFDIVFANASLQWVPDHEAVLGRWVASLRSGGQLAVQVPTNSTHPAHVLASLVASKWLKEPPKDTVVKNVLLPEQYAEILNRLGFQSQHVRLQIYVHHLSSTADVVEWVKGTTLTRFKEPLGAEAWQEYVDTYREELLEKLGEQSPYLYTFKRILMWGQRT